ncbi:MAG: UDP-N-acetylglucosamine 2-epimerase (non-hydrolyzing) [Planctomycetia bacterium]|nr:UDP-N-acetylglucosamine 2-epimerase (non-hydrolyzing) [Planctomycetia bacterium]
MAPVVRECHRMSDHVQPIVCSTGQHREMLAQAAEYFGIHIDVDLDLMRPGQSLSAFTARCLDGLDSVVQRYDPDCIVAQGDTTSVMVASIVAFYHKIPFVHVEAGLRTGDLYSPWPEEFNRRVAGMTAALHCAPTVKAAGNLLAEGVDPSHVHLTGNTVIDSLIWTLHRERARDGHWCRVFDFLGDRRTVLVTGHRRENFGKPFLAMCRAIRRLAERFKETAFVYPVHLNPNVREAVFGSLDGVPNVHLIEPLAYPEFVWLMDRSTLILTDSGGVQEEAPSLGKPVLVMRETTERPEAVEAGAAQLVGTSGRKIVRATSKLLNDPVHYAKHQVRTNPYGDGLAGRRIVDLIRRRFGDQCNQPQRAA